MPREAELFDATSGSAVQAFLLMRKEGKNVPPAWIKRARASRKTREKALANALRRNSLDAIYLIRDWELSYRKECFYHGIRVLMELEREGQSKL